MIYTINVINVTYDRNMKQNVQNQTIITAINRLAGKQERYMHTQL